MSRHDPRQQQLVDWLREQGHGDEQIDRILAKVNEYDAQTVHESIFDSIDAGTIDLGAIVQEALDEETR